MSHLVNFSAISVSRFGCQLTALVLCGIIAGCSSGEDTLVAAAGAPTQAVLHGVTFDPTTAHQFAGTALSGLTEDVVMLTYIYGDDEIDAPIAPEQVTVEVGGRNLLCWFFEPEGLLAKDTTGAIRVIGRQVLIGTGDGGGGVLVLQVFDQEPPILLPAPPLVDEAVFAPFPTHPGDETVFHFGETAPSGASGCLLLRHSGTAVDGEVVPTQNRDQWILPGAAMPFQARYFLSADRSQVIEGYRLSTAPGG